MDELQSSSASEERTHIVGRGRQRLDREGATKKDDRSGDNEREARGEPLAKQRKGDTFAQVPRSFEDTHL